MNWIFAHVTLREGFEKVEFDSREEAEAYFDGFPYRGDQLVVSIFDIGEEDGS